MPCPVLPCPVVFGLGPAFSMTPQVLLHSCVCLHSGFADLPSLQIFSLVYVRYNLYTAHQAFTP